MPSAAFLLRTLILVWLCSVPLSTGCGGGGPPASTPDPYRFSRCLGNTVVYGSPGSRAATANVGKPMSTSRPHVPGEVLIKFTGEVTRLEAAGLVPAWGARVSNDRVVRGPSWGRWVKAALPGGTSVADALEALAARPEVETVQPNYIYRIDAVPSDPHFEKLWGMIEMDLPSAWDEVTDCSSVPVAVIDTGVNYHHEDLAENMWDGAGCPEGYGCSCTLSGCDFVGSGGDDPMDLNGHGTHVAGIIGAVANNGVGVAGVCWRARIMAVRVMGADGAGTSEDISQGMRFAVDAGARVVNMSLGGTGRDAILLEAARHIRDSGAILVAAAGNDGKDTDLEFHHPGCFDLDNVINVAAVTSWLGLASFSNYGAVSVDVAAPGVSVWSTYAGWEELSRLTEGEGSWTREGDWGFAECSSLGVPRVLANPGDFCSGGMYENNRDSRAFRGVDLSGFDSAYLLFDLNLEVARGDFFRAACSAVGGDPFLAGGTPLFSLENTTTEGEFLPYSMALDACTTEACSFGFQLQTNASGQARGVAIDSSTPRSMALVGLILSDEAYEYRRGTSMAAPHVAGTAALLWSLYPEASYQQIVLAIFDGTTPLDSLEGKTCTGGMVNARRSLDLLEAWLQ